ncbi:MULTISPECIES: hypothetical protein [unclassified Frigoribacterium]|uniref:hypothetical protein n=1 Tax=unclassified Frigoribacterium TaxID=2627005 RepID=UPI0006F4B13E|nr:MULTISPECIES: hypothetical protein [unclassified Frigoribacterium]KQO48006.1 hypothetical protein ASF07_11520 [Frigoribacterium sp. Leaf254]KQT40100.1 hypothetical protein ASG28_11530 [Frigoribacterium sp. Leaf415]
MPTPDDEIIRRATWLRSGRDDHELRRRARVDELVRLAPGTYLSAETWVAADPRQRHALRVRAVVGRLTSDIVVSHESALALNGFPLLGRRPERVHVVDRRRASTLTSSTLVRHAADLGAADLISRWGMPTVVPLRAALDVARTRDLRGGLVVIDHGLRSQAFDRTAAGAHLEARGSHRGTRVATLALALADPLSESAGESLSRAGMFEAGLARPVLQKRFHDDDGLIGRVDFWWPCCGVVGEFDGLVKYLGRTERRGRTPEQVVVDEKLREDRIRALPGVRGFARWLWDDALTHRPMLDKLARAGLAGCTHGEWSAETPGNR